MNANGDRAVQGPMARASITFWLTAAVVAAFWPQPTYAESGGSGIQPMQVGEATGTFVTKFDQVSNNCKDTGLTVGETTTKIERVRGRSIRLTIPMMPSMRGAVRKGGKFRAKAKKGKTAIEGLEGRFSAGGRVNAQTIQFVFIAEYFRGKEPLCTQSWNVSGTKKK